MRPRTGTIFGIERPAGTYWRGTIRIDNKFHSHCSYDRSEVEEWLAGMVAENPTFRNGNDMSAARAARWAQPRIYRTPAPAVRAQARPAEGRRELWAVTAECDPCTVNHHLFVRPDWPKPERVLLVDEVNCVPIMWVADDNHGAGWRTEGEARERARELSGRAADLPDGGAVAYRARPYDGVWETREGWRVRR